MYQPWYSLSIFYWASIRTSQIHWGEGTAAGIVGHLEGMLALPPARARRTGVGRDGGTNYQGARIFLSAIRVQTRKSALPCRKRQNVKPVLNETVETGAISISAVKLKKDSESWAPMIPRGVKTVSLLRLTFEVVSMARARLAPIPA